MSMGGGGQDRLPIVVRPLDLALKSTKFFLIPAVVAIASIEVVQVVVELSSKASSHWLLIGVLAAFALYVPLFRAPPVARRVDHLLNATRRWVVTSCGPGTVHERTRVSCRLTPYYLRTWIFQYDSQRLAVERLAEAAIESSGAEFWVVEGASGTGKTRCVQLLVNALIRDPDHFELANRIFLYDLSISNEVQRDLLRRLGTPRHNDAIVVVDNFQQVSTDSIRALTRSLLDMPGRSVERLLVFLTRPGDAWSLSPGAEVRLISEAKRSGHYISINGLDASSLTDDVYQVDPVASGLLTDLTVRPVASAAQLHTAQIIATNREASPEVIDVLRLLAGKPEYEASTELVVFLGIVSALAAYRGSFTGRDFRRAVGHVVRDASDIEGMPGRIRLYLLLRKLRRLGMLPKMRLDGVHYTFHEAIAQLCVERLVSARAFEAAFRVSILLRIGDLRQEESPEIQWMLATEIGAEPTMREYFDAAAESGAFQPMVACLERCSTRIRFSDDIRLQFALLLDRVGKFAASRLEFDDSLVQSLASSSKLAAQLVIARLEVTHEEQADAELETLRRSPDPFIALSASYWEIHMAAHHGEFHPYELSHLASEAISLAGEHPTYFMLHSVARMHFDALRHLYLSGSATPSLVHAMMNDSSSRYLRNRLATFEALRILYSRAHLLGHVLLPMVAILQESVTCGDAGVEGAPESHVAISTLVEAARLEYSKAKNEFWQFGDREAHYLQADILNAELISTDVDFERTEGLLFEYRRFIEASGFEDMASYPYLYLWRWNVLKRFALLLNPTPDLRTADEYLSEARRCLRLVESLDAKVMNNYGLFRARVLHLLLDGVNTPLDSAAITELQPEAEARGYGFEVKLLRYLRDQPGIRPADLRQMFRFYPIVHQ